MTLIETLITTALFALVMAGVYLLYTTMQSTLTRGEMKSDIQQNARVAMDRMVREIRMAGYDPSGALSLVALRPRAAIRAATPACLSFVADVTGSGTTQQITYDLNGTTLRRRADPWDGATAFGLGGGAQPLAESVNLLSFAYFDNSSQTISAQSINSLQTCPPQTVNAAATVVQLDYWQMRQVRRIAIILQTREEHSGVSQEFFTVTNDVLLRNQ